MWGEMAPSLALRAIILVANFLLLSRRGAPPPIPLAARSGSPLTLSPPPPTPLPPSSGPPYCV